MSMPKTSQEYGKVRIIEVREGWSQDAAALADDASGSTNLSGNCVSKLRAFLFHFEPRLLRHYMLLYLCI